MKKILFICLLIFGKLLAQNNAKITLDEAIKIGLENRIELKNQTLQLKISQTENEKIKAKWLPQINGNADFRWNTQLQTTVLPFSVVPGESSSQIQLGLPFNTTLGIQADQKIYDANKKIDRQINDTNVENQQNSLVQQQINIRQAIMEAYYLVVFNKERLTFAQNQWQRNQVNLQNAETRFKAGTLLPNELERNKLDLSNAQLTRQKAQQDLALSLENLKYQINFQDKAIDVIDNLETILQTTAGSYEIMLERRPEIKSEETYLRLNELNVQKQKAQTLPSVSAYGNYSVLQLSKQLNPFAAGTWFPFNFVGIKANIPIFDGKQAKLAANDFLVRQQINRNNIEKYKADFSYEAKNALTQLEQAKLDITETKKNVVLAQQILATDTFRYEKGVLTISELKNTEFSLQNAENNYLSSVYGFLVAHIKYKKAIGNL